MSLHQLSITSRVRALGFVSIAAISGLSGIFYLSQSVQENSNREKDHFIDTARKATEVDNAVLNLRRMEKDFLLGRDQSQGEDFMSALGQTDFLISDLNALVGSPIQFESRSLKAYNQDYTSTVSNVVALKRQLGLSPTQGLEGNLRRNVHEAESRLTQISSDALTVKMLMMRRHEKDFMMRVDPKYISDLDMRVSEFNAMLNTADIPVRAQRDLRRLITRYQDSFHDWARVRSSLQTSLAQSEQAFNALSQAITDVAQSASEKANQVALESRRTRDHILMIAGIFGLLIIAGSLIMTRLISRTISLPIRDIADQMRQLTKPDNATHPISAPTRARRNELEDMSDAMAMLSKHQDDVYRLQYERHETAARAELLRQEDRLQIVSELEQGVSTLIEAVSKSSTHMSGTSNAFRADAQDAQDVASSAAQSVKDAANNARAVAQASEELSASVEEILRQAEQSQQAGDKAAQDTQAMESTLGQLRSAVEEVGEVVALINNIAAQTNLLSLNATIEAARAGEAGKGFAVVAQEVKQLADQTAKSTDMVRERINAIRTGVENAVGSIDGVTQTIGGMSQMAQSILNAVEQQKAATDDIAQRVTNTADNTTDLSATVQALTLTVNKTEITASDVHSAAQALVTEADAFNADATDFFKRLKAS